jgi:hypothetical protein
MVCRLSGRACATAYARFVVSRPPPAPEPQPLPNRGWRQDPGAGNWRERVPNQLCDRQLQHDTLLFDGGQIMFDAMVDEAGAGVAAIVDGLLTRLRDDLTREMRRRIGSSIV